MNKIVILLALFLFSVNAVYTQPPANIISSVTVSDAVFKVKNGDMGGTCVIIKGHAGTAEQEGMKITAYNTSLNPVHIWKIRSYLKKSKTVNKKIVFYYSNELSLPEFWSNIKHPPGANKFVDPCLQIEVSNSLLNYFITRPDLRFYDSKELSKKYSNGTDGAFENASTVNNLINNWWGNFPNPATYNYTLKMVFFANSTQVWIDDRLIGEIKNEGGIGKIEVKADTAKGGQIDTQVTKCVAAVDYGRFFPVNLEEYTRHKTLENTCLTLDPGYQLSLSGMTYFSYLPFKLTSPTGMNKDINSVDIGLSLALHKSPAYSTGDNYYMRSAFDGLQESIIFSLPKRHYVAAHILCAVEDDADEVPVFTARLTRYTYKGRGDALADTIIRLPEPGQQPAPGNTNIKSVGSLAYTDDNNKVKTAELYLVTVPLKIGEILDLVMPGSYGDTDLKGKIGQGFFQSSYLELELTKNIPTKFPRDDWNLQPVDSNILPAYQFRPSGPQSAVHVFGITLEESPVAMNYFAAERQDRGNKRHGNVFYNYEDPLFNVQLINNTKQNYSAKLEWEFIDFYGTQVGKGSTPVNFFAAGANEKSVEVPVSTAELGWFGVRLKLKGNSGQELIRHDTAVTILPPDTRTADCNESPFGTWWFIGTHNVTAKINFVGPLFLYGGLRKFVMGANTGVTQDLLDRYKGTLACISWYHFNNPSKYTHQQWMAMETAKIEEAIEKYPRCKLAAIFHEDGKLTVGGNTFTFEFPLELLNKTQSNLSQAAKKVFNEFFWDKAIAISEYYRTFHPDIKLIFGNGGWTGHIAAQFFRNAYPASYIDYLGVETGVFNLIPEGLSDHGTTGFLLLREITKIFGTGTNNYAQLPISAHAEWVTRSWKRMGWRRQAQWYMRDCLQALAYNSPLITPGTIIEHGDTYYHSQWGGGGLFSRHPLLAPRPFFAAFATLTRVMDKMSYVGKKDTGSYSLFALEFEKASKAQLTKKVYALWSVRGKRKVNLVFESNKVSGNSTVVFTNIVGKTNQVVITLPQVLEIEVDQSPLYVQPADGVVVSRIGAGPVIGFPEDNFDYGEHIFITLDNMTADTDWQDQTLNYGNKPLNTAMIDSSTDLTRIWTQFRKPGIMTLAAITNDPEKSACLEVRLDPQIPAAPPKIVSEYAVFKLKTPQSLKRTITIRGQERKLRGFGLWVKGNSQWGQVMWMFEDGANKEWISCGRRSDFLDHMGNIAINYDGWHFLRMDLPLDLSEDLLKYNLSNSPDWNRENNVDEVTYTPNIKFTGIVVLMNRYVPYLDELQPANSINIRLKDLVAIYK